LANFFYQVCDVDEDDDFMPVWQGADGYAIVAGLRQSAYGVYRRRAQSLILYLFERASPSGASERKVPDLGFLQCQGSLLLQCFEIAWSGLMEKLLQSPTVVQITADFRHQLFGNIKAIAASLSTAGCSTRSRRPTPGANYAKALDDLFAFCASQPLSRARLMEWRAAMESLSLSMGYGLVEFAARRRAGCMAGEGAKRQAFGCLGCL
jgi:hypothetical protein